MSRITIDDLLAAESDVLQRIADDIAGETDSCPSMAGHQSVTTGHRSSGTHTSHNSGVTSAAVPPKEDNKDNDS